MREVKKLKYAPKEISHYPRSKFGFKFSITGCEPIVRQVLETLILSILHLNPFRKNKTNIFRKTRNSFNTRLTCIVRLGWNSSYYDLLQTLNLPNAFLEYFFISFCSIIFDKKYLQVTFRKRYSKRIKFSTEYYYPIHVYLYTSTHTYKIYFVDGNIIFLFLHQA